MLQHSYSSSEVPPVEQQVVDNTLSLGQKTLSAAGPWVVSDLSSINTLCQKC